MEVDPLVRPFTAEDAASIPAAHALLNRTQGEGLFAADFLPSKLADPACHVVAAFARGAVVGVAASKVLQDFSYYAPFVPHGFAPEALAGLVVGEFSTMSIAEDFRGQGIGQILGHLRRDWLAGRGCALILGVSWVSGLAHTSARVFEKLGFDLIARCPDFYRTSAVRFACPGCHAQPCACAALLYRLDLRAQVKASKLGRFSR